MLFFLRLRSHELFWLCADTGESRCRDLSPFNVWGPAVVSLPGVQEPGRCPGQGRTQPATAPPWGGGKS